MKKVLVLHSYHQGLEWTDSITRGIQSILTPLSDSTAVYYEYLDTKRNVHTDTLEKQIVLLKSKYSPNFFDVIIAADNNALKFIQSYDTPLFTDTPVVFCGINNFREELISGMEHVTGIVEANDYRATLDLMLDVHPDSKKILIILDKTDTGMEIRKDLQTVVKSYDGRVEIEFYQDFLIEDVPEKISNLGPDELIYLLTFNRDLNNTFISSSRGIKILSGISHAPIYSSWDFYFGKGLTGGIITSGFEQGAEAARRATKLLSGQKTLDLPILRKSPNTCMFDFNQMQKFGIKASQIPEDCTVINTPPTLYVKYRQLFVLLGLTAIVSIAGLIRNLKKQQQKQAYLISLNADLDAMVKEKTTDLVKTNQRLNNIIDTAPNPVFYKDKEGIYKGCNDSFAEIILGMSKDEVIGKSLFDFPGKIPEDKAKLYHDKDLELINQPGKQFYEAKVTCADSIERDFFFNKATLTDGYGLVSGIVGVMIDISHRKQAEDALRESEERLKRLLDASFGGIIIHDQGLIIDANKGIHDITGYDHNELIGMHGLKLIAPEWRNKVINKIMSQDESLYDVQGIRKDGSTYPLEIQAKAFPYQGRIVRVTGLRDVSERKAAQEERERLIVKLQRTNEELTKVSVTDALTGVSNRGHIFNQLTLELKKAKRYDVDLTIVMIDIDHFKILNDTYGHPFGDLVLQKVCRVFENTIRGIDMIGRYGGEEFLFILPNTNIDQGYLLAERMRHNIESMKWDEKKITITISGGITQYHGESETDLLKMADDLLYEAKSKGRNRIEQTRSRI